MSDELPKGWECPRCERVWAPYVPHCNCQSEPEQHPLAFDVPMVNARAKEWAISFLEQAAAYLTNVGGMTASSDPMTVDESPRTDAASQQDSALRTVEAVPGKPAPGGGPGPSVVLGSGPPAEKPPTQTIRPDGWDDGAAVGTPGSAQPTNAPPVVKQAVDCGCPAEFTAKCNTAACPRK